jgi:DNA-binding transcriptional ArsR family regulator
MLKIFFEPEDLGRVRILPGPEPMWEITLSLFRLRSQDGAALFDEWRTQARSQVPASTRLLTDLVPARSSYFVDFLTPTTTSPALENSLEAIRRTPRKRLRTDLTTLAERMPSRHMPSWTSALGDGEVSTLNLVSSAARQYFDACLAPHWPHVPARVNQERFRMTRMIAEVGVERALTSVHPTARWRPPVLELGYPTDRELHLCGRGLVLLPSFYCLGLPTSFCDEEFQPVLVYPIQHELGWAAGGPSRSLVTLLGKTRASSLEVLANSPCTTSELARQLNSALATASQHASVLRDARLVTSRRIGQAVLHSITPLGLALVSGNPERLAGT